MHLRITRRIQTRLGLTRSEAGVILFLTFGLIIGGAAKMLKLDKASAGFDFAQSDSCFQAASSKIDSIIAVEEDTLKTATIARSNSKPTVEFPVDLNRASLVELTALPGVGKTTAQSIIDFRNSNLRFTTIRDLLKVKGIGPRKFEKIKPFVKAE
jgi:comEA protein